jgi:hypothetical protein
MMQRVLTGDDIKTLRLKGESCPIRLHPGDVWRFGLGLAQHAQGPIESHQPCMGHYGAICDQLIARATADIQERQSIRSCSRSYKSQEVWIDRFRPIRLRIVEMGNGIIIYAG